MEPKYYDDPKNHFGTTQLSLQRTKPVPNVSVDSYTSKILPTPHSVMEFPPKIAIKHDEKSSTSPSKVQLFYICLGTNAFIRF